MMRLTFVCRVPSRSLQKLQSASPRSRSPFLSEIELLCRSSAMQLSPGISLW